MYDFTRLLCTILIAYKTSAKRGEIAKKARGGIEPMTLRMPAMHARPEPLRLMLNVVANKANEIRSGENTPLFEKRKKMYITFRKT